MLENMKKETEKLLKYFSKNVKEASEFKYRSKVIENNTFEERFLTKIGFSALPFLFLMLAHLECPDIVILPFKCG